MVFIYCIDLWYGWNIELLIKELKGIFSGIPNPAIAYNDKCLENFLLEFKNEEVIYNLTECIFNFFGLLILSFRSFFLSSSSVMLDNPSFDGSKSHISLMESTGNLSGDDPNRGKKDKEVVNKEELSEEDFEPKVKKDKGKGRARDVEMEEGNKAVVGESYKEQSGAGKEIEEELSEDEKLKRERLILDYEYAKHVQEEEYRLLEEQNQGLSPSYPESDSTYSVYSSEIHTDDDEKVVNEKLKLKKDEIKYSWKYKIKTLEDFLETPQNKKHDRDPESDPDSDYKAESSKKRAKK